MSQILSLKTGGLEIFSYVKTTKFDGSNTTEQSRRDPSIILEIHNVCLINVGTKGKVYFTCSPIIYDDNVMTTKKSLDYLIEVVLKD